MKYGTAENPYGKSQSCFHDSTLHWLQFLVIAVSSIWFIFKPSGPFFFFFQDFVSTPNYPRGLPHPQEQAYFKFLVKEGGLEQNRGV